MAIPLVFALLLKQIMVVCLKMPGQRRQKILTSGRESQSPGVPKQLLRSRRIGYRDTFWNLFSLSMNKSLNERLWHCLSLTIQIIFCRVTTRQNWQIVDALCCWNGELALCVLNVELVLQPDPNLLEDVGWFLYRFTTLNGILFSLHREQTMAITLIQTMKSLTMGMKVS